MEWLKQVKGAELPEHVKLPRTKKNMKVELDSILASQEFVFQEYQRLQEYTNNNVNQEQDAAQDQQSKGKNRYVDILPYDWRRVRIEDPSSVPGDHKWNYINASWIIFPGFKQKFIAMQAPLQENIKDLWQVVAEMKIEVIVMLTQLKEGKKRKSPQYWPDLGMGEEEYGKYKVTCREEKKLDEFTKRTFELEEDGELKDVVQIQVKDWGDYGVPPTTNTVLDILAEVRGLANQNNPILVHCSAGVGRSGTYIAVHKLVTDISSSTFLTYKPDVFSTVLEMRKARPKMVQKKEQYLHIFQCIRDSLPD